jgi:hypothetical protein
MDVSYQALHLSINRQIILLNPTEIIIDDRSLHLMLFHSTN